MCNTKFNSYGLLFKILHSTGLEFQHQVEEAKDLDQLIKIHYRYLSTIHDRCLLREKVGKKIGIFDILSLAGQESSLVLVMLSVLQLIHTKQ